MAERGGFQEVLTDDKLPAWQVGYQGSVRSPAGLASFARARLRSFQDRLCLAEVSGSLGDLGTLIPLLTACAHEGSVRLGPAMLWMGIFNIVSAWQWDIPMPVQPMKSIAAVAISDGMDPGAFAAAGIVTGSIVWLLGITRLIDFVNMLIPKCVIAGMQVGLGVRMASKGCAYWHANGWIDDLDGKLTCLLCFLGATALLLRTKLPTALIIFSVGAVLTVVKMIDTGFDISFHMLELPLTVPTRQEWLDGFVKGAIPQLPLTTLNSVVSVCALSVDLFREPRDGGKGASRVSVASSVGLMNVVGCWFGGMPSCHGAGGLAGQYRFGARGGCSILMLGLTKVALALVFGQTVDVAVGFYPQVVLGVLLLYAGVELASVGAKGILGAGAARDPQQLEKDLLPCFVTAGAYIGTKNMALGVAAGLVVAAIQRLEQRRELLQLLSGAASCRRPSVAQRPQRRASGEATEEEDEEDVATEAGQHPGDRPEKVIVPAPAVAGGALPFSPWWDALRCRCARFV